MKRFGYLTMLLVVLLLFTSCTATVGPDTRMGNLTGFVGVRKGVSINSQELDGSDIIVATEYIGDYQPLPGAVVKVSSRYTASTGSDGMFYVRNIPVGKHRVIIDHKKLRTPIVWNNLPIERGENPKDADAYGFIGGIGYYIVIGVEYYPYLLEDAPGAINDARKAYDLFRYDTTLVGKVYSLFDSEANRGEIQRIIAQAAFDATDDDYLVFYFAGLTGSDYISPYDERPNWVNRIKDWELENWLSAFPGDVTVIVDGSESFSLADGEIHPTALKKPKYTVISSSKGEKNYVHPNSGNGLFTYFLSEGLRYHLADENDDRKVTAAEIHQYTEDEIRSYLQAYYPNEELQTPYLWPRGSNSVIFRY